MLHFRHHHFVTCVQETLTETAGHQVDRLGSAFGEDDLVGVRRMDELLHSTTGLFEAGGGELAEVVYPSVDVAVDGLVVVVQRVDHHFRLLRGGGVVEIYQRIAVDLLVQNGEVFTKIGHFMIILWLKFLFFAKNGNKKAPRGRLL